MSPDDGPGGRCVLVVDDDPSMRRFLEVVLRRAGFAVATAETGAETMAALLPSEPAAEPRTRAVALLLDAMLPDMRGFDLARRLVDHPATAQLPICFLTGAVHGRVVMAAGIACVVKPSSPVQIVAALEALLESSVDAGPAARRKAVDGVEALSIL